MPLPSKVRTAYRRGGLEEIVRGTFYLGLKNILDISGLTADETQVLRSSTILNGTPLVSNFQKLPTIETPSHFRQSKSRNPFDRPKKETEFLQSYQYSYRPDFVYEIENIRLLGPNGIGITKEGLLLEDSITMPGQERISNSLRESYARYPLLTVETLHTSRRSTHRSSKTIECACSLYSSWNNYYHWILEHLPKLRAIEHYEAKIGVEPVILIPNNPPSYIRETLKLLDVPPSNCVHWKDPAIDIETLIQPAYPEPNPENLHWLRTKLRNPTQKSSLEETPERIYISRKKAPVRQIKNEKQVLESLREFGFERVFAEDLSVANQIRLFSNAEEVIGPHGAGLTNMIWGDEMTIFEIHNDVVRDHYFVLANNLGHDYFPIQGDSTHPADLNSNITVDVEHLKETLSDAITR